MNLSDELDEILGRLYATNEHYVSEGGYDVTEVVGVERAKQRLTALFTRVQVEALERLPDNIKEVEVSGVAVPRNELDKISIQDLRLVIAKLKASLKEDV